MGGFANKQYVKKMAECYNLKIVRSHRHQSLAIYKANGDELLRISDNRAPEIAWEDMWGNARQTIEIYTGINILDDWREL